MKPVSYTHLDVYKRQAEALDLDLPATGDRLAIVGNSRGLGVLAADALFAEGGRLARFSPATENALCEILPSGFAPDNPLDLGGDAGPARFTAVLELLLNEREPVSYTHLDVYKRQGLTS